MSSLTLVKMLLGYLHLIGQDVNCQVDFVVKICIYVTRCFCEYCYTLKYIKLLAAQFGMNNMTKQNTMLKDRFVPKHFVIFSTK